MEKHGDTGSRLYRVWAQIKTRCLNPNYIGYEHYGGRGITVCPEWIESYRAFRRDVGDLYVPGLWIERVDNDRGYEPGNVRWATPTEQRHNQREHKTGPVYVQVTCSRCGDRVRKRGRQVRQSIRDGRAQFCGRSCAMRFAQEQRVAAGLARDHEGRFV